MRTSTTVSPSSWRFCTRRRSPSHMASTLARMSGCRMVRVTGSGLRLAGLTAMCSLRPMAGVYLVGHGRDRWHDGEVVAERAACLDDVVWRAVEVGEDG